MKVVDAINLGHRSLTAHKRRSLVVVIVVGVLFGVVTATNLLVQGLMNKTIELGNLQPNGEVLLVTKKIEDSSSFETENNDEKWLQSREEIEGRIREYGGEVLGSPQLYIFKDTSVQIYPKNWVEPLIKFALDEIPDGTVPTLAGASMVASRFGVTFPERGNNLAERRLEAMQKLYDVALGQVLPPVQNLFGVQDSVDGVANEEEDNNSYDSEDRILETVVGMAPSSVGGSVSSANMGLKGPLELLMDFVPNANGLYGLVDDRMGTLQQVLGDKIERVEDVRSVVAKFPDLSTASKYAHDDANCLMFMSCSAEAGFYVEGFGNNLLEQEMMYGILQGIIGVVSWILWVVAAIVVIFTLMRLIRQEEKTIALYRALGATAKDLMMIYGWYMLELCLWTVVFIVVVGTLLVLALCAASNGMLLADLSTKYGTILTGWIVLWGWNGRITLMLMGVLVLAPMCLVLNTKLFSQDVASKKLK